MSVRGYERKAGDFPKATNQQELFDYLESLNCQDWADILIDLVLEPARVARLIVTDPDEDLAVRFATHLRHLGMTTKRLVEDAIVTMFSDARTRLTGEKKYNAYRLGLFLMTSIGTESRVSIAMPLMSDYHLPDDIRVIAAAAVAEDAAYSAVVWERLDLKGKDAVLAPTAIAALAEWDPEAALRLLSDCQLDSPDEFEYPVEMAVRALLKRENGFELLATIAGGFPTSVQAIVGASPSFRMLAWNRPFSRHQLGLLEGALGMHVGQRVLSQVIVVSARIDAPDDKLRESVRENFRRGVQYLFIVPDSRWQENKDHWFLTFKNIAQDVVNEGRSEGKGIKELIDIWSLPSDWDDVPYIFYRLSVNGSGKHEIYAVRGNEKKVGIASQYTSVPKEYAETIALLAISAAQKQMVARSASTKSPIAIPNNLHEDSFNSTLLDQVASTVPEWNEKVVSTRLQ
ncbi:MAG: hypothetical protein WCI11_19440 [Candidatus Methylumidiphilus sp.]